MKLNKDFLLHNLGEETVLVPTGKAEFSGIVRGNKTLGAVLELLKTDTTEAQIIEAKALSGIRQLRKMLAELPLASLAIAVATERVVEHHAVEAALCDGEPHYRHKVVDPLVA